MSNLSAYALSCGYLQSYSQANLRVTLWREHGVYHVRAHEFDGAGRLDWQAFRTLHKARKHFGFLIRHLTNEVTL